MGRLKAALLLFALIPVGFAVRSLVTACLAPSAVETDRASLQAVAAALQKYRAEHGRLPPPVIYDSESGVPRSWRVELLPHLGMADLAREYRHGEAWDSPHNRRVLEKIPACYRSATESEKTVTTCLFALTGERTAFGSADGLRDPEITDPWSSLITLVSARREIPWTKPEDIVFDEFAEIPELGGFHDGVFHAMMADGSVRNMSRRLGDELLKQLIISCDGLPNHCD